MTGEKCEVISKDKDLKMLWSRKKSVEENKKDSWKTRDRSQSLEIQCFPVGLMVPGKRLFSLCEENELSPVQSRLHSEQLIFDIYLNSPSKKRRNMEAIKVWDCQKFITKQNEKPSIYTCMPFEKNN